MPYMQKFMTQQRKRLTKTNKSIFRDGYKCIVFMSLEFDAIFMRVRATVTFQKQSSNGKIETIADKGAYSPDMCVSVLLTFSGIHLEV